MECEFIRQGEWYVCPRCGNRLTLSADCGNKPCHAKCRGKKGELRFRSRIETQLSYYGIFPDQYQELVDAIGMPPECAERSEWWMRKVKQHLGVM